MSFTLYCVVAVVSWLAMAAGCVYVYQTRGPDVMSDINLYCSCLGSGVCAILWPFTLPLAVVGGIGYCIIQGLKQVIKAKR